MERSGIRSLKARELIRRAEMARASGDNRATLDNLANAKEVMLQEKKRHKEIGDLAKLPKTVAAPAVPEETTKEKLQKELPKNYLQAKFMLGFAQKAIDARVSEGGEVSEATSLLAIAQKEFDGKDYDASLKHGVQARKAAEELIIEIKDTRSAPPAVGTTSGTVVPPGVEISVTVLRCRSCGADLKIDDTFCRKCGVKVELAVCPSCGTKPAAGDAFCRKCGVALG
jgi:ribosomal protein L40E